MRMKSEVDLKLKGIKRMWLKKMLLNKHFPTSQEHHDQRSALLPLKEDELVLNVAQERPTAELGSAKVNAHKELLQSQVKLPPCRFMWILPQEHSPPSWSIAAQLLF